MIKKTTILLLTTLIILTASFNINAYSLTETKENTVEIINVGIYPLGTGSDQLLKICLNYQWTTKNGTEYKFEVKELTQKEIKGHGEKPLNTQNYDVFIVGANYRSYLKTGQDIEFRRTVKKFLSNGGGYLGVCAGAFLASQGYENPENLFEKRVNKGALQIANVYLNDDLTGELQYLLKEGSWTDSRFGQIPIEVAVNQSVKVPIFSEYNKKLFNISYGGGAGLYKAKCKETKLGEIKPLLKYNEELNKTKPIYFWKKALLGWVKDRKVKTDIKDQYAGIATNYDENGRIVLLSSHPEIPVSKNGTIEEYFGKNTLNIPRIVYAWKNGEKMNMSHNWWIHRRTVAWLAGIPVDDLPSCNELMVFIDKPQFRLGYRLYIKDQIKMKTFRIVDRILSRIGKTVIIGDITVEVYAENSERVEFYIDNNLEHKDNSTPFKYNIDKNLHGVHEITVKGYDEHGNIAWDGSKFLFL